MTQDPDLVVVPWTPPAWATSRVFAQEAVEHRRHIGDVTPLGSTEPISVEVVQRDELNLTGDPEYVVRSTPQIRVAGVRLNSEQAREFAHALNSAAATMDAFCD